MKKGLIKFLKIGIPIGIGVALIWYSLSSMGADSRAALWENIKAADPFWVGISLVLGFVSHFLRAYRWKYLLEPLGCHPKLSNSFMAVMVAYVANLGIPRSGEVLRAVTISRYEKVRFEQAFGTIISERVADLVLLMLVVATAFFLQSGNLLNYFESQNVNPLWAVAALVVGFAGLLIALRIIRSSKLRWVQKINNFLLGILDGTKSILKMKNKGAFIFQTLLIWTFYVLMFWVIKYAVPNMEETPWGTVMVAFVAGSFSMSTTNGGLGIFPYPLIIGAVFAFSGIPQEQGEAYGWVIWGSQTALNIIIGGASFLLLPILNPKK